MNKIFAIAFLKIDEKLDMIKIINEMTKLDIGVEKMKKLTFHGATNIEIEKKKLSLMTMENYSFMMMEFCYRIK